MYVGRVLPSSAKSRTCPSIQCSAEMWEGSYMSEPDQSPLQAAVKAAVDKSGKARDHLDKILKERLKTSGKPLWDIERGKSKKPEPRTLRAVESVLCMAPETLVELVHGAAVKPPVSETAVAADDDLVEVQQIDLAYGMGATFTDNPVNVDLIRFPKSWLEAITHSPPALLTWARGSGDSMEPTIHDGDIVLLDRSQRRVAVQDALWAFTIGDIGQIKRLRVKGDRMVILSDNPNVPADEEFIDFVNIVARVIYIGRRV